MAKRSIAELQSLVAEIGRHSQKADTIFTEIGNQVEPFNTQLRQYAQNVRARRAVGTDLSELVKRYNAIMALREQFAVGVASALRALELTHQADQAQIEEAVESAGLAAITALAALRGEKK